MSDKRASTLCLFIRLVKAGTCKVSYSTYMLYKQPGVEKVKLEKKNKEVQGVSMVTFLKITMTQTVVFVLQHQNFIE